MPSFSRRALAILIIAPTVACTTIENRVWSDAGGVIEVTGEAVENACYIWQNAGVMTTNCHQNQQGLAPWSGLGFTKRVYSLKAIPDPGYTFAGWEGCDASDSNELVSWRFYTSNDGSTCHLDHGVDGADAQEEDEVGVASQRQSTVKRRSVDMVPASDLGPGYGTYALQLAEGEAISDLAAMFTAVK